MKRSVLMTIALVVGIGSFLSAQEADRVPTALTASATIGFPTSLGIGAYTNLDFLDGVLGADRPYVTGAELNFYMGSALGAGQIFANSNQKGLVDSEYYYFPDGGLDSGLGFIFGFSSYTYWYDLDLGFAKLPLGTGFYGEFGGAGGNETYSIFEMGVALKTFAVLKDFPLLKPFMELGIGTGTGSPTNAAAREKIAGGDYYYSTSGDNYTKYWLSSWAITPLHLTIGARYDLPLSFFDKAKAKKTEKTNAKADKEASKKAEADAKAKAKLGAFQFPQWLRDYGGMSYFPEKANPMAGSYLIGPQNMFGKFSFSYQSSVKDNKFNKKYDEATVLAVLEASDSVYSVKLKNADGSEETYTLYRLQKGQTATIDGKQITPDEDGVYYDGKVFGVIAMSSMK